MKKIAVITGSTGGIGSLVAERLAEDDWNLILINRSQSKSQKQVEHFSNKYPNQVFKPYYADFLDLSSVKQAAAQIADEHKCIHALYNISGYITNKLTYSAQDVESQLAVNALAPYVLVKALTANLAEGAKETSSYIVNFSTSMISSIKKLDMDNLVRPKNTGGMGKIYARAKLLVNIFNQSLKDDLANQGVSILAVCPGPTKTKMTENMEGAPWIFKILMPLLFKDADKQTNKLVTGINEALATNQTGLFISEGKVKREPSVVYDKQVQGQVISLLDELST